MFKIRCRVQGHSILLLIHEEDVFVPNLMSWFSAARMRVVAGETFCDVGTGSGLHAILAAKMGARRVYGTDINPVALRFARLNARNNRVSKVCRFLAGDLTSPLVKRGIRVDSMIYNAPQFPGRLVDPTLPPRLIASVNGGPDGNDLNARFVREAAPALKPGGRIYNPVVEWSAPSKSLRAIRESGYRARTVARVEIPPWGWGNNMRAWLLERPGKHRFAFRHRRGRDTSARLLELRQDGIPLARRCGPSPVEVDFSITA